jgi:hypothetical protein
MRKDSRAKQILSRAGLNLFAWRTDHITETYQGGGSEMKPDFGRTILGGFVGTLAITMLMYEGGPMMGLPKMDIAAMLGQILGGWIPGIAMHFANGVVIFPLIYAYLLFSRLPGAPAVKGITWGVALWVMAQLIVMPMMGAGLFGLKMAGMMSAVGSLMGHVVYGALLGWIGGDAHPEKIQRPVVA